MIGWSELCLILILALIILGPNELIKIARFLGKVYAEYQKAKREVEFELIYGVRTGKDRYDRRLGRF